MHALTYFLIPSLVSAAAIAQRNTCSRAAYLLKNNPLGENTIVSLKVSSEDGSLSSPYETPTGGSGLIGHFMGAEPGDPATVNKNDSLFSQGAVEVYGNYLFNVNPGSHSVSMFFIPPESPETPILVGKPADTTAEFPNSVTYSPLLKTACALNGGAIAGVACFSVDPTRGLSLLGSLRPITVLNQTTPPVGPPLTASDITFNPSQTALIATLKGNGKTPGYIFTYPVYKNGTISHEPVISRVPDLLINFSISWIDEVHLLITDPAYGAALINVLPNNTYSYQTKITIPNESATCWSVYSERFNSVFVMDAGVNNITIANPWTGEKTGTIVASPGEGGGFDSVIDKEFLYVLRGTAAVSVFNADGLNYGEIPSEVQTFNISEIAPRNNFQGFAIYPKEGYVY